jgi:hypothetical protein
LLRKKEEKKFGLLSVIFKTTTQDKQSPNTQGENSANLVTLIAVQ